MDRSEALMHLCNHLQGWEDRSNTPPLWYFCGDEKLRTHAYECAPITKADWMAEIGRNRGKPPIGLQPRKLHEEQRIADISAAIIRYVAKGNLVPLEWLDELYDLVGKQRDITAVPEVKE